MPELHLIAKENIKDYTDRICILNADEGDFSLKMEQSLIFLFNPFDEIILKKFLSRNIETIKSTNSVLAYVNDLHSQTMSDFGLNRKYRNHKRKLSIWM